MQRMEHQEMSTAKRNDSVTNAQKEASQLLNNFREAAGPKQKEPGVLEFSNIFSNLPERSSGQCSRSTTRCEEARRFQTDPEYKLPSSREWRKDMQKQRVKDLDVDTDGKYKVSRGDTVWTIAERLCRGADGKRPDDQIVDRMKKRLIEANPQLKCNPNFLKEGERLTIPPNGAKQPPEHPAIPKLPEATKLPETPVQKPNESPVSKPGCIPDLPVLPRCEQPPKSTGALEPRRSDEKPAMPKEPITDAGINRTETVQRKDLGSEVPIKVEEREVPRRMERTVTLPNGERVSVQTGAGQEDKVLLKDKDGNPIKEKTSVVLMSDPPIYVTEFENGATSKRRLDTTTIKYPDGTEVTIENGQFKRITKAG